MYNEDRGGDLSYGGFLELMDGRAEAKPRRKVSADTELVVKSIRRKLMDFLGPGVGSARKINETFAEIDANRSGTIDKREFEKAMSVLRVDVSASDVRQLFD